MDSYDNYINIQRGDIMKNNKRGDILYYSISQVANLLGQEDSSIRYYTNVFDNILKIEISNKELRYTNNDIDKLEFLINLKNKGMTIKEIQKYCEELPLDIEELVEIKQKDSLPVEEVITRIVESESRQINALKEHLDDKIEKSLEMSVQKIINVIQEEQHKQLTLFKDEILTEVKEYIEEKLAEEYKTNTDLYNDIFTKLDNLISEKSPSEYDIKLQLDQFNKMSISRDKDLINEIKRFENVIQQAYYIQQDLESQKTNVSFIGRLFGIK